MRSKKAFMVILLGILAMSLAVAYYIFDPAEVKWMPRCLWKMTTGTDCPGCGSQRMAHALMHGDFVEAWHSNAYALCIIPLILFLLWLELCRDKYQKLYRKIHTPWVLWILVASVFVWWIARNLV